MIAGGGRQEAGSWERKTIFHLRFEIFHLSLKNLGMCTRLEETPVAMAFRKDTCVPPAAGGQVRVLNELS
jgi:hypothetical protein